MNITNRVIIGKLNSVGYNGALKYSELINHLKIKYNINILEPHCIGNKYIPNICFSQVDGKNKFPVSEKRKYHTSNIAIDKSILIAADIIHFFIHKTKQK